MFNVIEVTQDGHAVVDTEGLYRVQVAETGEILEELCEESEAAAYIGSYHRCGNTDAAQAIDYRGNVADVRERDDTKLFNHVETPEGKRIRELSGGLLKIDLWPTVFCGDEEESKGHQIAIGVTQENDYLYFGFEVWVDDRDNEGDLSQSVVEKLFQISDDYRELAETVAGRLQRNRPVEAVEPAA